jgi:hypothetical protein
MKDLNNLVGNFQIAEIDNQLEIVHNTVTSSNNCEIVFELIDANSQTLATNSAYTFLN